MYREIHEDNILIDEWDILIRSWILLRENIKRKWL